VPIGEHAPLGADVQRRPENILRFESPIDDAVCRRYLPRLLPRTSDLSDFTLTDRHRDGLRAADAGERPPFELTTAGRPLSEDLAALPADAEYLAMTGKARACRDSPARGT
jgi:hypothetical protein